MKKIIWIDVGTHFGQEYGSIFGSNYSFYLHMIRRFIGANVFKRGKFINYNDLREFFITRARIRDRHKNFHTIFVEANPKIAFTRNIYLKADMVFNMAMTNGSQPYPTVTKLYLGHGNELSQGSSILIEKKNVRKDSYIATLGVSSDVFFRQLCLYLNEKFSHYDVLLRLNCEGVEDDVIYSAYSNFGDNLKLVCGALKDVEEVKGLKAYQKLEDFMKDKGLLFETFHSGMYTWPKAHAAVLNLLARGR